MDEGDTPNVASHRLTKVLRGRAALSFAAVAAVATLSPGLVAAQPAAAQPPVAQPAPTTESEALQQYRTLSDQAGVVNEELLKAQADLVLRKEEHAKATADVETAKLQAGQAAADEEAFRTQVDELGRASFQGARFNRLSALLTGSSTQDFLDRASMLGVLAADNDEALDKLSGAVQLATDAQRLAEDAQHRAQEAITAAELLTAQITEKRTALDGQIAQVRAAMNRLSNNERARLADAGDQGVYIGGPGAAGKAVDVALAQRGKMYVWGAAGPNTFDCSGLTMYAYAAAGISLPHSSRSQYTMGKPVSRDALAPGDLLFYGSSAGTIHHVAMYVGGGMIVHASTSGQPVKVVPVDGGGSDYFGAKRIVG